MGTRASFDAIVVGSGAAGGFAAKQLTEQGLAVLLLEAGPALDPSADFPLPAPPPRPLATRVRHGIARQPIQMRCPAFNARTQRFFVDDADNPYTTPPGSPYNWFRGRQVGGRLRLWGRVVMRLSDLEFKGARGGAGGIDWPLAYADLVPAYEEVERFLGVRGDADAIASVPDSLYCGRSEMTAAERAFKVAVEAAHPERRVIGARLVAPERERMPATLRAAQRTGRLTLRADAIVRHIDIDPATGKATGVTVVDRRTKGHEQVTAQVVVLCASTIESVRILQNSACERHPSGIGGRSGRLGRGLVDHVLLGIGGPSPRQAGAGGRADTHATHAHEPHDAYGEGGAIDAMVTTCADAHDPYDFGGATGFYIPRFRNVAHVAPAFARGYALQGGIGRGPQWYLMAHGEMLPRADNCITVDPHRRDAWDIPVAHIACTWSQNERAMIADAAIALHEVAAAAGLPVRTPPSGKPLEALAFRAWRRRLQSPSGAFLPGSAIHELGGAAMGAEGERSVLNAYGQCWDARNVFVTDGACFASGCSQNVTLTIMALTVRACGYLVQELRGGRL